MPIRLWKKIVLMICYSRKSQSALEFSHFISGILLKFIGRDALPRSPPPPPFNTWLPRSSHITPPDFFFWAHIKGTVYVPPLPSTLPQLPGNIRAGAPTVTPAVLANVPNASTECVGLFRVPSLNICALITVTKIITLWRIIHNQQRSIYYQISFLALPPFFWSNTTSEPSTFPCLPCLINTNTICDKLFYSTKNIYPRNFSNKIFDF